MSLDEKPTGHELKKIQKWMERLEDREHYGKVELIYKKGKVVQVENNSCIKPGEELV